MDAEDSLHSSFGSDVSGASLRLAFPDAENGAARGRGRGRGRGKRRGRSTSQDPTDGQDAAVEEPAPKRGRGRGGRRGRGQAQRQAEREAVASLTLTRKKEQMRDVIAAMSEAEVRETLLETVEKQPSLMYDILDQQSRQTQQPERPSPPQNEIHLDWCSCSFCRDMPTEAEKLCCGKLPSECISRLANFQLLMLDEEVLDLARLYRQDFMAVPLDEDLHRGRRHAAYRQFILWQHGRLGAGHRLVIPSCCVWRIRDKFPDRFGQYTGFIAGRLG